MKVIERIGKGGFGVVDKVIDDSGVEYAQKTFSENQPLDEFMLENVLKRFSKEVRIQSGIEHRNIVPIVASDLESNPPSYLMPLADRSLDKDIASDRTLGGSFLSAISDIVAGLEELHSMQIYHRDLKPQNVLRFTDRDGDSYYAVSDFGLISLRESRLSKLTVTGMAKGSDYYTAPDVTKDLRKASAQSDVYSLGCIIHDMVGLDDRVPCAEINEQGAFGPILRGCTRVDPAKRFKSTKAVLDALMSVEFQPQEPPSEEAVDFISKLEDAQGHDQAFWGSLATYLEGGQASADRPAIFGKMTRDTLEALFGNFPEEAERIGLLFCEWVENSSFNFDFCDALANRVEVLLVQGKFDLKVASLFALLEMGVSHNRWYVERRFVLNCSPDMDDNLAKRFAVELHIRGKEICRLVEHLEWSIATTRGSLHPRVVEALKAICE